MVKFQDLEIQHTAKYNEIKVTRKSLASVTFGISAINRLRTLATLIFFCFSVEEQIKDHKQYVLESSEKMDKAESQVLLQFSYATVEPPTKRSSCCGYNGHLFDKRF